MANISELAQRIYGEVVEPGSSGYDEGRKVWNGSIDKRPAAIVYATGPADVVATVRFARETGLPLAIRAGGHNPAGLSTCDDGILLCLSRMRSVEVDAPARTARVAGGTLLGQLDHETTSFGLATPSGTVGHTGVAGLTLGGGFGRLSRKHGLSIDNLLSVEIVTADGRLVRASEDENDDLFWGVRGAGPNFGVVTSLTFRLHPLEPPMTYNRLALYAVEDAADAIRAFRSYAPEAPEDMISIAALIVASPAMPIPPELHGRRVLQLGASYCGGAQADGERATEVVKQAGTPLFDLFLPAPYRFVQGMMDERWAWGRRYYDKGGQVEELTDAAIDATLGAFERMHSPGDEIDLISLGGAISRVPDEATAYTGRAAQFFANATATWTDPADDDAERTWTRGVLADLRPHLLTSNYINAVEETDEDSVRAAYGDEKYKRLVELKTKWDPDNVFRLNQNIRPL